jgi:uncharacterized protein YcfJ
MKSTCRNALAVAALAIAAQAAAQVTFYENPGFSGRSFTTESRIGNFARYGFNDRASSATVQRQRWEVCEDARFGGRCVVLRPGRYPSLAAMGLNDGISSVRAVSRNARIAEERYAPPLAAYDTGAGQITFYESEGYGGRSFSVEEEISNLQRYGFNDRASSAVVGEGRWEVCQDRRFAGRCTVLRPGRYPSLAAMGLNDRISSLREVARQAPVDDSRYAPVPRAGNDYRRINNERLYEAEVTAVRAVVGPPERRCWVEREQVVQERADNSVPGTIAGAVIGGILGHQVGGGRGQDLATAGGAVAGAVVGNRLGSGSGGQQVTTQNVQRCANVPDQDRPDYWDVSYVFRGQEHRLQMSVSPGATITVNERGEPRT